MSSSPPFEKGQPGAISKLVTTPGTLVEASDGTLGQIDREIIDSATGAPQYLLVGSRSGDQQLTLPISLFEATNRPDKIHANLTRQQLREHSQRLQGQGFAEAQTVENGQQWHIPLVEEQLRVEKRQVELGKLQVRKLVDEVEETQVVPLIRDDVEIQRVAINQQLSAPAQSRQEGEWLIVPVMKEVLVVEKRLMLVEEVRIRRRSVTEQQTVKDTVRRERLEFEDTSGTLYPPTAANYQAPPNS